jgi:pimeloyl-ACP methyl ester carboxylesterase
MMSLIRLGWGADNPAFRQMFTVLFIPDGTKEQWDLFTELERISASAEAATHYYEAQGQVDVTSLLPKVKAPTLVMHARGDLRVPFEMGRMVAAGIPGARFVALPGRNHIFQQGEPAFERFVEEIGLFLAD